MVTVSGDITDRMKDWLESQIETGLYKSQSEVIREALRELMVKEEKESRDYKNWFVEKIDSDAEKRIKFLEKKGLL